MNVEVLTASF